MSKVKVGHFHLGNSYIAFESAIEIIGFEAAKAPTPSVKSIDYGVAHSPEFACFPFKTFLGTYKDCVDKDARFIVTIGGRALASCQLEDYHKVQQQILRDNGHDITIIDFASSKHKDILDTIHTLNKKATLPKLMFAMTVLNVKLNLINEVEDNYQNLLVLAPRTAEKYQKKNLKLIRKHNNLIQLYRIRAKYFSEFRRLKNSAKKLEKRPLRIALIGDIYTMNESILNRNIIIRLAKLGVIVKKTITMATMANNFLPMHQYNPKLNILKQKSKKYLARPIGGFADHTIMSAVESCEQGYDGLIHIYPFTCMPEVTARAILPKIADDYNIPILYIPIDEQTGEAGMQTRLEAFVDLLEIKRKK